jgi:cysteinyl-tRNA synthetase
MERLRQATRDGGYGGGKAVLDAEAFKRRFIDSMDDDFNTAQAVAVLFDLVREINRAREENCDVADARNTLVDLAKVLGFTLEEPTRPPLETGPFIELLSEFNPEFSRAPGQDLKVEQLIQQLIETREKLRQAREWQKADLIRNRLIDLGVALEDTPKGTVWKRML